MCAAATRSSASLRPLVEELFRPASVAHPDGSIGAELELIPVREISHRRVGIASTDAGPGTADIARDTARTLAWTETIDAYGAPSWITPDGGSLRYEPGGQLEIISPVFGSTAQLSRFLRDTLFALRESAARAGVLLLTVGVDPFNEVESVALELHAPRYDTMARYFESIGPSGARMMRQTASLHVSVELGKHVMARWGLLNSLAPYLTASFANSSTYLGHPTGYVSYRSFLWQALDSTRTGLPFDAADPVGAYTRFAQNAGRILADDAAHLTTLFPEIRPRGYFEIRSLDAMEPDRIDDALRFISSIVHDADVASAASDIIGAPDPGLLVRAARHGRSDPEIRQRLESLERLVGNSSSPADDP
jgi:glutamate--cysteine ligase